MMFGEIRTAAKDAATELGALSKTTGRMVAILAIAVGVLSLTAVALAFTVARMNEVES